MVSCWFIVRLEKGYKISKVTSVHISGFYLRVKSLIAIKYLHVLSFYDLLELLNEIVLSQKTKQTNTFFHCLEQSLYCEFCSGNITVTGISVVTRKYILFGIRYCLLSCIPSGAYWLKDEGWQSGGKEILKVKCVDRVKETVKTGWEKG